MNRFTLTKREYRLMGIASALLLFLIAWNWAIEPMIATWSHLQETIETKELLLTKYNRIVAQKDAIRSAQQRLSQLSSTKNSIEQQTANLLGYVERAATNSVSITNIRPLPVSEREHYDEYQVEFEFESDMKNLTSFLYSIEQVTQPVRIKHFQVAAVSGESAMIKAKMTVVKWQIN